MLSLFLRDYLLASKTDWLIMPMSVCGDHRRRGDDDGDDGDGGSVGWHCAS